MEIEAKMCTKKQYPKQIIYGDIPSKANSYFIGVIDKHYTLIKSKVVKEYEQKFILQCSMRDSMITSFFSIDVDFYYKTNRKDLDGSFKAFFDCLQLCHVIKNDRQCIEIHARKLIDKANPRIEFTITEEDY